MRVLMHGLLHSGWLHLALNMYVFYNFGRALEVYFMATYGTGLGILLFVLMYAGGIVAATIPAFIKHSDNHYYNSIGASGAVAGVLFAVILLYPDMKIGFILLPVGLPAWVLGLLYLAFESYMNRRGNTGIAHDAHPAGAAFGILLMTILDWRILQNFWYSVTGSF